MAFNPRIVVFDLDGTLAESKQRMGAEMGELLSQLLKKMPVAVMSGAGFTQFEKQFFTSLPPEANLARLYIFPDNAAQCYVHRNDSWHAQYDNAFTPKERERILATLDEALKETGLREVPVRVWGTRVEDRGAEIAFSPLGQDAPLEEKEKWHRAHEAQRRTLHQALEKKLPDFANAMGGLTTIDITRKGITKAYGLQRLAELTGIEIREMLYVGDALEEGGNDAVVVPTGIHTHAVFSPMETETLIESLLGSLAPAGK